MCVGSHLAVYRKYLASFCFCFQALDKRLLQDPTVNNATMRGDRVSVEMVYSLTRLDRSDPIADARSAESRCESLALRGTG